VSSILSLPPTSSRSRNDTFTASARLRLLDIVPHADELANVEYISRRKDGAGSPPSVSVWLFPCEKGSVAAIDALNRFASGDFARKSGAEFAILMPQLALSATVRKVARHVSPHKAILVVNGVVFEEELLSNLSDLEREIATESLLLGSAVVSILGSNAEPNSVLFGVLASRDIDASCGIEGSGRNMETAKQGPAKLASVWAAMQSNQAKPLAFTSTRSTAIVADISITVIADPVGKYALPLSAFTETLIQALGNDNIDVSVLLTPPLRVAKSEVLRTHFSRMVYSSKPEFYVESGSIASSGAWFAHLPQSVLLTFGIRSPRSWFVSPDATNFDLDNVVLNNLPADVPTLHAEYALSGLLVEGSCIDERREPPQGLRLQMTSQSQTKMDTLVMANLGYYQFLAYPGRWRLQIAPGRGRDIFDLESMNGDGAFFGLSQAQARTPAFAIDDEGQVLMTVDSLNGVQNSLLNVKRKLGMELSPLLDPGMAASASSTSTDGQLREDISGRISSFIQGIYLGRRHMIKTPESQPIITPNILKKETDAQVVATGVHVFSVASGHLYERFLKIMMLSVTKHATESVTFWLLENYLSPSLKKILPRFAVEHGFQVRMVTYRWPSWLREQTEKQRVIWAYKILFLDVLFPLDLKRVIFVDSDQVVRGDLAELMRLDMQGAPYGYVPFCDSRKEVEGFRFWKSGFWKDVLQGAAYHISALYVVDLDRFRETSAGDSLRFIYQSLSADPNSLSNLDQDLPNYAAVSPAGGGKVVPIFDLPQEWLWCESWCDDNSKSRAQTIDLCNNPMTKEPKLESAKRIISEWVELDNEAFGTTIMLVQEFTRGVDSQASQTAKQAETVGMFADLTRGKDEL
jgi:UDP-glucose:glycoprotein glucosyltransferase